MSVYIIGFFISTLLYVSSDKADGKRKWILNLAALLIPCIIAGCRNSFIGTDVRSYLMQMTDAAISSDGFLEYLNSSWYLIWRDVHVFDYEIGFDILVYIVAIIFKNIYAVQFAIQAFTVIPIFIAVLKMKKDCPVWLGMLTYYLMLFNVSLNLMRQSIGMAFIVLAYAYFCDKEIRKCILATLVAVLFHTSALIGIVIFLICWFVNTDSQMNLPIGKEKNGYYTNMVITIMAGVIAVVGINLLNNLSFLSDLGLNRFLVYINGEIHFMPNQVIGRLPVFIFFMYAWKKMEKEDNMRFLFTMLCLDLICSQFTSVNQYAGRIALYFSQFEIFTFPTIYTRAKKNHWMLFLLIAYMAFYWWYYYAYKGANATIPYVIGI